MDGKEAWGRQVTLPSPNEHSTLSFADPLQIYQYKSHWNIVKTNSKIVKCTPSHDLTFPPNNSL